MNKDEWFMRKCFELAKKGGNTSPNPRVGALVVKEGNIISEGYHKGPGFPHAEIDAMNKLRLKELLGATLYVNLEPCCHTNKRTPPCTKAIIAAGIKKVVCAMKDPNPYVNGKGIDELRKFGIKVKCGVLREEAEKLNEKYIKYITTGKPFVSLKVAMSLDGKIATRTGESKWISGEKSREFAHGLRSEHDGIMVGINTILMDNPRLRCYTKTGKNPARLILDSRLRIPMNAEVLKNAKKDVVIIATTEKAPKKKIGELKKKGVIIFKTKGKHVNLRAFLNALPKKYNVYSVLLEGGGTVDGAFFDQGLIDKLYFFISPKLIGGKDAKTPVEGKGVSKISEAVPVSIDEIKKIGNDLLIIGYPKFTMPP